ncbi:50S ribosomal protein L11 [miscellaneous Crenarchaeota group-15 archaeon DG-45]|uniref:Large ribosomal subunit protein uL11 n=1 Tax=miscellaneous Crenarchaeota group-15 archaeon DG-45 TaxID=1685127 RepID=A0A0M0BMC2_9ARCH|nr:MAG: 50S ribosomal protein L11 [miscellaneous Crenarchaeota group-15 archaeon DG-45]
MVQKTFNFIVSGGEATGGPPIGPALGPLGINIMGVVNKINELTAEYKGTKVPVDVTLDTDTKEFAVKVGMLSTYALVMQALEIAKGSPTPNTEYVGDLSFDQLVEIARRKREGLLGATLRSAVKEVLGSCLSMGATVDGKSAKEVFALIEAGSYDESFKGVA